MKQIYPDGAVILAPIAGHSDLPMRLSARRHGCRFAFTEMVDAGSLVYQTSKTLKLLEPLSGKEAKTYEPVIAAIAGEVFGDGK